MRRARAFAATLLVEHEELANLALLTCAQHCAIRGRHAVLETRVRVDVQMRPENACNAGREIHIFKRKKAVGGIERHRFEHQPPVRRETTARFARSERQVRALDSPSPDAGSVKESRWNNERGESKRRERGRLVTTPHEPTYGFCVEAELDIPRK